MAMRRARVLSELEGRENDENASPMAGDEVEIMVQQQERHLLVRCLQPRRHPRIPLRDITHLFPGSGNVASLDDKTISLALPVQRAQGNGPVRRPLPSSTPQKSRKRRQPEPSSETTTVRRVLPKFR